MTYPGFPFPPQTPLYPDHTYIHQYHRDFAKHFILLPHIRFNQTVIAANWVGDSRLGQWDITIRNHTNQTYQHKFDHLVVATGNNHFPNILVWPGQEQWLKDRPQHGHKREILHSIWYRHPEHYKNRTVVVVGSGASGRDVGSHIVPFARKVNPTPILMCSFSYRKLDLFLCQKSR